MQTFLQDTAKALAPLLDSIGDGVLVTDPAGTPVVWNAAAERILGASTLRATAGRWTERPGVFAVDGVTPLAREDRPLTRAIRGELVTDQEFSVRHPDGRSIFVSSTARALRDPDGHIIGGVAIFRETTERRRAEVALRDSERLYRLIAGHLPSAVLLMYDRDLRFTLAGGGGLAAAGLTPAQVEGRPVSEYATPMLLPRYAEVFEGTSTDQEVVRNDGRIYRVQLVPLRDELEQIFAGLMLAEDVTENRRRDETAHRQAHLHVLAQAIPQIVWTAEPDGNLDYYNQHWFDYTGMTLEQTQGWGWQPVLHPDDVQTCIDRWSEAVRTGNPYEVEYRFKRASDGTYRWHLGRALPVRGADGKIQKWFGTCTDIDDQRRAQDALRESGQQLEARVRERTAELLEANAALQRESSERRHSDERFRAAIAGMLDAFYIAEAVRDAQGTVTDFRIVELNEAGAARIGRPRAACIGLLQSELAPPGHRTELVELQARVIETRAPLERELEVQSPGNLSRWVRHQIVPLGDGVTITTRDITFAKTAVARDQRLLREKETLLKEIHHRVKNNLQVISSVLKLQADQITDPATRDVFRDSQARVRSIALLHEKLYQSEDLAHVDMRDYVDDLTRRLLRTYGAAASHVRIEVQSTGVSLDMDAALPCGLIINELVTNALKHAFGEHDTPGRVTVRLMRTGDAIELSVWDDGKGLPPGLDLETSPTLGVQLVMALARQLEGSVEFDRAPGARCTVQFLAKEA
ncbi:MAG: PAS domain-containing protein [Kofleriaceae bacterium]